MTDSSVGKTSVVSLDIQRLPLWNTLQQRGKPLAFELEVTARCNNHCRHCYIDLPAIDVEARSRELSLEEIARITRDAVRLGSLWCLITGGEPLLREDFADLFLTLRRQGLLVSVFTNACLVKREHAALFKKYPPRDIEVSVYGATQATYEWITRRPGSFAAFRQGLELLTSCGVPVRLKAMALRSNVHELEEIGRFCRRFTKDFYRFDPLLHLRCDGDPGRNEEIRGERLSPEQIAALESPDAPECHAIRTTPSSHACGDLSDDQLFHCRAGQGSFSVSYDGTFRLCSSLCHPGTTYDLRSGTLAEAWHEVVPTVRGMRSSHTEFVEECRRCSVAAFCPWCPAHAALETGTLDKKVEYFCQVARARAAGSKTSLAAGAAGGSPPAE